MFDLINFGNGNYRGNMRGAGTSYRPFGNPELITEKAFIVDDFGELEYNLRDANNGEQEGHYVYIGNRTVGNIVEHRWRFV